MRKCLLYGLIIGVISSFIIGLYFKWVEKYFHVKVYTLLLNIDYLPILKHFHFSEKIEFFFHIIVSVVLAMILIMLIYRYSWSNGQIVLRTILISFFIGICIYPTTIFSERTPEITSLISISHWIIGHFLYGIALSISFILADKKYKTFLLHKCN